MNRGRGKEAKWDAKGQGEGHGKGQGEGQGKEPTTGIASPSLLYILTHNLQTRIRAGEVA